MMCLKRVLPFIFLLPSIFSATLWAQTSFVTWQDLATKTLKNHPDSQLWAAQTASAQAQQASAAAKSQPQVKLQSELSYAWMQQNNFPRTANQVLATYPIYAPNLNAEQTLTDWQTQAQQAQVLAQQQTLLLAMAKAVTQERILAAQLQFLAQEREAIRESLAQVQQRFQVGYQDLNDVAEVQAQADTNQAAWLAVQQQQAQALAELEALIGESITPEALTHLNAVDLNNFSQDAWPDLFNAHPQVQALQALWQAKNSEQSQLKSLDGPQVNVFGAYVYNDSDKHFYDDMQGVRGGVQLSVPLYLGGATDAKVSAARAQSRALFAQKQTKLLELKTAAQKAWLGIQAGQGRLQALKSAVVSNQQALKAAQEGLKTGARNILDVLNAQNRLSAAQQEIPSLQAKIQLDQFTLLWALGRLDLSELAHLTAGKK